MISLWLQLKSAQSVFRDYKVLPGPIHPQTLIKKIGEMLQFANAVGREVALENATKNVEALSHNQRSKLAPVRHKALANRGVEPSSNPHFLPIIAGILDCYAAQSFALLLNPLRKNIVR